GKDFCHSVIDLQNQIKNAQQQFDNATGNIQSLMSYLPQNVRDEVQNSDLINSIAQALTAGSSLSDVVGVIACACRTVTSSGLPELGNAIGNCADAAFCAVGLESGCDCGNPPPNTIIDCADVSYDGFAPVNALYDPGLDIEQFGNYLCQG